MNGRPQRCARRISSHVRLAHDWTEGADRYIRMMMLIRALSDVRITSCSSLLVRVPSLFLADASQPLPDLLRDSLVSQFDLYS
jgi:hypothetical protein